jgi:hypothetical protein
MKKFVIVFIAIALIIGATSLFAADNKKGGFELGLEIDGVLLPMGLVDMRLDTGPFILDVGFGFVSAKIENPTLEISNPYESETVKMFGEYNAAVIRVSGVAFQGGVLIPYWRPPHMKVYSGLKGMIGDLNGEFENTYLNDEYEPMFTQTYKLDGTMYAVKIVALGWDFQIPGVDNLVLSTSIGFKRSWVSDITVKMSGKGRYIMPMIADNGQEYYTQYKIDPNLSGWSTDFTFGARVAF